MLLIILEGSKSDTKCNMNNRAWLRRMRGWRKNRESRESGREMKRERERGCGLMFEILTLQSNIETFNTFIYIFMRAREKEMVANV